MKLVYNKSTKTFSEDTRNFVGNSDEPIYAIALMGKPPVDGIPFGLGDYKFVTASTIDAKLKANKSWDDICEEYFPNPMRLVNPGNVDGFEYSFRHRKFDSRNSAQTWINKLSEH